MQLYRWVIIRGVTRHLSHETRRDETWDTRLGSRERDETRFLDFFFLSSKKKYIGKIVFYSTEKHKMQKM